jgi:hypothetical protein
MVRQTKVIKKIDLITTTNTTNHKITHKTSTNPIIIKELRTIITKIKKMTALSTTIMAVMINMKILVMVVERTGQFTMLEETVKMKIIKINLLITRLYKIQVAQESRMPVMYN